MEDLRHTVSSIPEADEVVEPVASPESAKRRVQGDTGNSKAFASPGRPPGVNGLAGLGMADGHTGAQ